MNLLGVLGLQIKSFYSKTVSSEQVTIFHEVYSLVAVPPGPTGHMTDQIFSFGKARKS